MIQTGMFVLSTILKRVSYMLFKITIKVSRTKWNEFLGLKEVLKVVRMEHLIPINSMMRKT